MKFEAVVSCPDCSGEDPMGCFEGGVSCETFDTREEAEEWAENLVGDSIWQYKIYEL